MRAVSVVVAAAAVTATCALGGAAVVGAPEPVTASRIPVTITASSLDVGRLVYDDTVSVQTSAGPVVALQLHVDGATFHGLVLDLPCVPTPLGGLTGRTTTEGPATAPSLTVYATDVIATIDGTRVRLSSTDATYPPPPAGTVLAADGTVVDPAIVSLLATSDSLQAAHLSTTASFCSPAGSPALHGGVPLTAVPAHPSAPTTLTPSTGPTTAPTTGSGGAGDTGTPTPAPTDTPTTSGPGQAPTGPADPSPTEPSPTEPSPTEPPPSGAPAG